MASELKKCNHCGESKAVDLFDKDRSKADGRASGCKACRKPMQKAAYQRRLLANPNFLAEQYAKNRDKSLASSNAYAEKHYDRVLARAKEWYQANKDRKRVYDARRRAEKRELYRAASKRFRDNRPGRKNADTQSRRAQLALRQPRWQSNSELIAFYEWAARVTKCLGIRHCVDHVIPLRGRTVSGLHVPGNLQVIPETLNLLKSNHFGVRA